MKSSYTLGLVAVLGIFLFFGTVAHAGNKQLMSEKMAKQDLKRNLMESVVGYKVRSEGEFGLTDDARYSVDGKAAAIIKGVKVDKLIYDPAKDIAFALGHIDLGEVNKTIVGDVKRYKGVTVYGFGFGSMTEESRKPLFALRAAFLNAYDEMAAVLVGEKISSYSEADNFVLTKDTNKSKVLAAVYGAHVPNPEIDSSNRGWGWDKEGNAYVKLEIDVRKATDMLGQRIKYTGPNLISVLGRGSQIDELAESSRDGDGVIAHPGRTEVEHRDLDIPVVASPFNERKGASEQFDADRELQGGVEN